MRLMHLGDFHLGKRVNGFSMLEDQKYILRQIIQIATDYQPDGILLAGDVYDKSIPSLEAVGLLDDFLTKLSQMDIFVCMIAGNHDSADRLEFASRLLSKNNIHIAGVFQGKAVQVTKEDSFGIVNFFLLPFIKPQNLWPYCSNEKPESFQDAIDICLQNMNINMANRNILVAHQFVIWKGNDGKDDGETSSVGGVGEVDAAIFAPFDYTALGHLHKNQKMGRENIRYAGSPLKYSFSEAAYHKTLTMIDLAEKGSLSVTQIPLQPLRDMRQIQGPLEGLLAAGRAEQSGKDDYIRAILTDENPLIDPLGQLRSIYPNIMVLEFDNLKNSIQNKEKFQIQTQDLPAEILFSLFYEKQNGIALHEEQLSYLKKLWQEESK